MNSGTPAEQNYVVLARKWRPSQFSDIVGQHPTVRTLMNAIRAKRISQAYLFTGSRGIGKTSIARIFAKAIRCENTTSAPADAPEGKIDWLRSCGQCASCREITTSTSVDVIEIDGASNNGVEAVREIRENAKYMPSNGARKIYIIDEVHMLTTAAFNALLKTLEEPPAHVIFIFATTEPHKIPATILSRCQRFDFKRVTVAQITTRLLEVTQAEGIQAEPAALALIARAAEGGMRDAMSLLDQVISFSGNTISAQAVRDSIGLIEGQTLLGIVTGVFARKPLEALALVDQAYQRGHDLRVLARSLLEVVHGAVLAKVGAPRSGNLELSDEEWGELEQASALRSLEEIELIFQVVHHGIEWIARSSQPKAVLDVLLVKCATAEALVYADGPSAGPTASSTAPVTSPASAAPKPQRQSTAPEARPTPQVVPSVATPAPVQPTTPATAVAPVSPPTTAIAPVAAATPTAPEPQLSAPTGPKSWEGFITHVRKTRPLLASILEHGHCSGSLEQELVISYPPKDAYYREQLQSRIYSEQLLNLSKEYFARPLKLSVELREGGESVAAKRDRELKDREQNARTTAQNHPMILEAKALFGGELGPIELTDSGSESHAHP
jgi:DNA polymerase III subunit gamma/tau